jgi:hypothetical protein
MKYLLLLPLVLLALWLILRQRGSHRDQGKDPAHHKPAAAAPTPAPPPTEIISFATVRSVRIGRTPFTKMLSSTCSLEFVNSSEVWSSKVKSPIEITTRSLQLIESEATVILTSSDDFGDHRIFL